MRVLSRVGLATGMCSAILLLVGCQGLVAGSPGTTPKPSTVTITLAGTGTGTVSSSPAGISCGATCTAHFADGAITLTASPNAGSSFTGWSGACTGTTTSCSIPAGSTASATATFASGGAASTITVVLAGSGTGTVTSSPAGISCGTTCTAHLNGAVILTATPSAGFSFTGWSGGGCTGATPCTVPGGSTVTVTATFSAGLQSINHIIILLQENRSFDHYFAKMNEYRQTNGFPIVVSSGAASVDELPAGASNPTFDQTGTISSYHLLTMCVENPSPFWSDAHRDYNLASPTSTTALNNGFVTTAADESMSSSPQGTDLQGRRVMGYYDGGDLPFYYFLASNFAMSDRWFSPVMTRTQANRMYTVAATSDGHVYPLDPGVKVNRTTIFEELQNKGVSWRIYVPDAAYPDLIGGSEMAMFTYGTVHPENFVKESTFASDAANGTLPQVAYIAEGQGTDEHPAPIGGGAGGNVQTGSSYVEDTFLRPLMTSQSWKDSVFLLSWDEGGGFYDHVPPQKTVAPDSNIPGPTDLQSTPSMDICYGVTPSSTNTCGFDYTGFRVPMMVISPFAKKNYLSHSPADHTAFLKLIEARFGVASLTARDAAQIDMSEFFDFVNAPWMTPPSPPTQPTNGPCYVNMLP